MAARKRGMFLRVSTPFSHGHAFESHPLQFEGLRDGKAEFNPSRRGGSGNHI